MARATRSAGKDQEVKEVKKTVKVTTKDAKKNVKTVKKDVKKTAAPVENVVKTTKRSSSDRAVDEIRQVLDDELSSEDDSSEEDDVELKGLSEDESIEDVLEPSKKKSKNVLTTTKEGHSINKAISKSTPSAKSSNGKRGVVYVGRIPKGFEERELKTYFSQFGTIINLRLSRNKKSGASKHFGFIEFESLDVAKVAAETMNNYLLEGHLLQVNIQESIHEELFKGANRPYIATDWNKINREKNDNPKTTEEWAVISGKFEKEKADKQNELTELGFDYDLAVL